MRLKLFTKIFSFFLVFLVISFITSCSSDKKNETVNSRSKKIEVKTEKNVKVDSSNMINIIKESKEKVDSLANAQKEKVKKAVEEKIPSLTGIWKGKFDKRNTILKITDQKGNTFTGKITINYRQQINQKIAGSINPKTLEIEMKDLLHSRYQGSYLGKLSKDFSKYNGTFTMKLDGKKFTFNLNKQ